jgi:uncharacterized membrane protein YfhO
MLGLLALMCEGKFKLYVISLALAVLFNFFIGYIICVFVVISFLSQCAVQKLNLPNFLRKLRLVAVCSALAAALTAVLTIPTWSALQNVYDTQISSPTLSLYTGFFDVLGNFIAFTPSTSRSGLPNLYSGLICVMLAGLFMQSKKNALRKKIVFIGIFVFLLISTNIELLDFIMHGFHFPNGFPARFSFLISFILVDMAYRTFILTKNIDKPGLLAIGISASLFLLSAVFGSQKNIYIIGSAILCAFYFFLYYFSITAKTDKVKISARAILFMTMLTELSVTSYISIKTAGTTDRDEYYNRITQINTLLNKQKNNDSDFYRTEFAIPYRISNSYFFNYNGVSFFSSTLNPDIQKFMQGVGLYSSRSANNSYHFIYNETSPLTGAFLNMRYMISDESDAADKSIYWKIIGRTDDTLLLENKYYLPLGFMVDKKLTDYKRQDDPFLAQNNFFRLATGLEGDLFMTYKFYISEPATDDNNRKPVNWDYQFPVSGMIYAYCLFDESMLRREIKAYNLKIYFNRTETIPLKYLIQENTPYIFTIGNITPSDNLTFSLEIDDKALMCYGFLNSELFERGYAKLASQVMQLTEFTNTKVKGEITVLDDGLLYTSIPADKNWSVYADGVKREIDKIDNAMIAVSLNKGYHEIEFRYFNTSFLAGGIISLVSLALFIALPVLEKRKRRSGGI